MPLERSALGHGEYDRAHLAMHVWPERVVPKSATDRILVGPKRREP